MASFGDSLRRERELRGIDLRDVAEATKISIRFLQALESDRIEILPGGIFPRSFVRQYANYLGLDADRKVAEFLYHFGNETPAVPAPSRPRSRLPVFVGVGVVVLAALGAWGFARWRERPAAESVMPAAPTPTFPPDRVYPPPTPTLLADGAVPTSQGLVLALAARQTCWVAVQADGKKVVDRVLNPGETESVTATSELVLSVGNAGGVSFTVNGRPGISLGDEGVVRRNIPITRQSLPSLLQELVPGAPAPPAAATAPAASPSAPVRSPRPRPVTLPPTTVAPAAEPTPPSTSPPPTTVPSPAPAPPPVGASLSAKREAIHG
jgi:transcriptional regulator with XRE-family HTH domain